MDSIDLEVLNLCEVWLSEGWNCLYVTVVRTWGSSPRPIGATMAIRADGAVIGSVSGGCIEDDLVEAVSKHGIIDSAPHLLTYGISSEEAQKFGLPCGGTIQLFVEPLASHSRIPELAALVRSRSLVKRTVNLVTGDVELTAASSEDQVRLNEGKLISVHGPRFRLLIIGAGQLTQFIAQIATALEYQVTVCDPREEYRATWKLDSVEVVHAMPDDLVIAMQPDGRTAVLALTHDPKLDDLALMEALRTEAFFVGAIGSRSNNTKRRERLRKFDLSEQQIEKLRGPVGLYIGSKTPYEIAISILAELTAVKNGVSQQWQLSVGKGKAWDEGDNV